MHRVSIGAVIVTVAAIACLGAVTTETRQQPAGKVDFATEIQPILRSQCISCHGPKQQKNGLRLDRRKDAMRGGTIAVLGPGNAEGSRLFHKLIGDKYGPQMPPDGALPAEQIAKIKLWIDQGAEWPDALSGEAPLAPPDPAAARLMDALRAGNRTRVDELLTRSADSLNKPGPGGATPLMYAALYGDAAIVRALLDRGADVKASDEDGATALMWALPDIEKVKLLLAKGADVNARSADARTPLLIASGFPGSAALVTMLLDAGANIRVRAPSLVGDMTPLVQAAYIGEEATFKLLVERGADVVGSGVPALGLSMRSQCGGCVETMMKALDPAAYTETMLLGGPPRGPALATAMLLGAGADINAKDPEGRTALMLAAASGAFPVEIVKMLIARGVDVNARALSGETALTFARRHGNTPVAQLIEKAGGIDGLPPAPVTAAFAPVPTARAAVARSLPLLQRADEDFVRKSGCVSCHHNTLTAMTVALARSRGIPVNEKIASVQVKTIGDYVDSRRGRALQGVGIPGDSTTMSYILLGLAAEKYAANATTDAMVRYMRSQQTPAGFWLPLAHRLPIEGDPVQTTAFTVRAMQLYAPAAERAAYRAVVDRAGAWLAGVTPETSDGRAFKLLGMHWAGASRAAIAIAGRELVAQQRADGGWSQLPSLDSDAYVTGEALVALIESGAIATGDPVYKRGAQFLLKTQFADGSWHVRGRAVPLQPHFESGFPYGRDQFISAAATNWAAMALAYGSVKGGS